MASSKNEPNIRIIIQQCLNARLQIKAATDEQEGEFVEINRGAMLMVCFFKGATSDMISKAVKAVLNIRLSEKESGEKVSVLELPGDVLILPQSTLAGKKKANRMSYDLNLAKSKASKLFQEFTSLCQETVRAASVKLPDCQPRPQVKCGSYNFKEEILSFNTNGPYTHILDI